MDDEIEITYDIVPLDRPPEDYFGYNYAYGKEKLLNATRYLEHKYGRPEETQAIELLTKQLTLFRFNNCPNL